MNQYSIKHVGLPSKDIFKPSNDNKLFISIDMKKANFSALRYYDKSLFRGEKHGNSLLDLIQITTILLIVNIFVRLY